MRKTKRIDLFRRFGHGKDGIAATEFALAAPMMIFGLIAMADLGLAANQHMELDQAVRAGADFVMNDVTDETEIKKLVIAAATGAYSTSPNETELSSRPTVTADMTCECPEAPGVAVACTGTLCANLLPASTYYTITASQTYSGLFLPDIPLNANIKVQTR